jgi:hypothetical protein
MSEARVQGKIHLVEETKTYGQNGFRKRLVVLEQEGGRFTNYIPLEFVQDACDSVDSLQEGDSVEIRYRLTGRKWQKDPGGEVRFFLNAEALGFKHLSSTGKTNRPSSADPDDDEPPVYDDSSIPF